MIATNELDAIKELLDASAAFVPPPFDLSLVSRVNDLLGRLHEAQTTLLMERENAAVKVASLERKLSEAHQQIRKLNK